MIVFIHNSLLELFLIVLRILISIKKKLFKYQMLYKSLKLFVNDKKVSLNRIKSYKTQHVAWLVHPFPPKLNTRINILAIQSDDK